MIKILLPRNGQPRTGFGQVLDRLFLTTSTDWTSWTSFFIKIRTCAREIINKHSFILFYKPVQLVQLVQNKEYQRFTADRFIINLSKLVQTLQHQPFSSFAKRENKEKQPWN